VFAPPRKYLTEARVPNDLGLHAKELADVDREEDIHSARERLAKLIVGRPRQVNDCLGPEKDLFKKWETNE
jgi:hypothetical protein